MMRQILFLRSLSVIAGVLILSVIIIAANVNSRQLGAPEITRYIPTDVSGIIYIPSMEDMWRATNSHTAHYFEEEFDCKSAFDGIVANALQSTACSVQNMLGIELFEAGDSSGLDIEFDGSGNSCDAIYDDLSAIDRLRAYGVSIKKSALFATRGPLAAGDFLLVLPVDNKDCFHRAAEIWSRGAETAAFQFSAERPVTLTQHLAPVSDASSSLQIDSEVEPGASLAVKVEISAEENPQAISRATRAPWFRVFPSSELCSTAYANAAISWSPANAAEKQFVILSARNLVSGKKIRADLYFHNMTGKRDGGAWASAFPTPISTSTLRRSVAINGREFEIGIVGPSICYAVSDDGNAFLFSNFETFKKAVSDSNTANPMLYERSFRDAMDRFAATGNALKAWAYFKQPGLYLGSPVSVALSERERFLHARLRIAIRNEESDLLTRILNNPRAANSNISRNGSGLASASLFDRDLSEYLNNISDVLPVLSGKAEDFLQNEMNGRYRSIYDILLESNDVNALQVDFTKDPKVGAAPILAVSASAEEASKIVFDLQARRRFERDSEIISRALEQQQPASTEPIDDEQFIVTSSVNRSVQFSLDSFDDALSNLRETNAIVAESNDLFERLRQTQYERADFENDAYCGCLTATDKTTFPGNRQFICKAANCKSAVAYSYIFPPVTDNDMKYRYTDDAIMDAYESNGYEPLDSDSLSEIRDELKDGHYRMVAAYDDDRDVLLIAPHLSAIESAIGQSRANRSEKPNPGYPSAAPDATARLSVAVNPFWLSEELQLSADEAARNMGDDLRAEVSQYQYAGFSISSSKQNGGLVIDVGISK